MNELRESLLLVPTFALYYLINEHLFSINKAEGRSMDPTIKSNGICFVNRWPWQEYRRNDIIIAKNPFVQNLDICKRILYVQGERIPETNIVIPPNHVWVEGDNKVESFDSRHYGPIPSALIQGKVMYLLL